MRIGYSRKEAKILTVALVVCLVLTSCSSEVPENIVDSQDTDIGSGLLAAAWLDAPLNGSHIPLAPYEIVFHVTDPSTAALGELVINGSVEKLIVNPENSKLATMRHMWNPEEPGKYIIQVRGQNPAGEWSIPDEAVVYVGEIIEPSHSPSPSPSEEKKEALIRNMTASPTSARMGSCEPNQVSISAEAFDPDGIKVVVLFYRFRDANGSTTSWGDTSMDPQGDGRFGKTISIKDTVSALGFNAITGSFEYQIVIQDMNDDMMRSEIRSDVSLSICADLQLKPIRPQIIPSPTPIIIK